MLEKHILVEIQGSVSKLKIYIWGLVLLHFFPTDKFSVLLQSLLRSEVLILQGTLHSCFPFAPVNERCHQEIMENKEKPLVLIVLPTCSLAVVLESYSLTAVRIPTMRPLSQDQSFCQILVTLLCLLTSITQRCSRFPTVLCYCVLHMILFSLLFLAMS